MHIDRRRLLLLSGIALLPQYARASDENNAVFWQVTPEGRKGATLFGYVRIAPTIVPDIVRDGEALVDASERVVIDMPQSVRFGTVGVARPQMKPVMQIVSPATADRLRKFVSSTQAPPRRDRMSGL